MGMNPTQAFEQASAQLMNFAVLVADFYTKLIENQVPPETAHDMALMFEDYLLARFLVGSDDEETGEETPT